MNPELSFEEYKQIADLTYNPGYKLLLESLRASLDNLSQQLQESTPQNELHLLAKWRVFREIYAILAVQPESIAIYANEKEGENEGKMPNRVFPTSSNMSRQEIERLKKIWEEKTGKKVVIT